MNAEDIPNLVARLQAQETTLPDPRDAHSENEQAHRVATRRAHARAMTTLMNAPADLARERRCSTIWRPAAQR